MLLKTFLCGLLFFFVYALFIELVEPTHEGAQNGRDQNKILMERYVFAKSHPSVVIVGTSMSARFPREALSSNVYNLSLIGGTVYEALEILTKGQPLPKQVLIEVNTLDYENNFDLSEDLFSPVVFPFKKWVKALRTEYQPMNLMIGTLKKRFGRSREQRMVTSSSAEQNQKWVNRIRKANNKPYKEEPIAPFVNLQRRVEALRAVGVQIVFFEVPMHPAVASSLHMTYKRNKARELFPPDKFSWIMFPAREDIKTTDGLHLAFQDAEWAAQYLMNHLPPVL